MKEILVCVLLQFIFFIPFYLIWRKDCKEIGKDNLALSLRERFLCWVCFCPIWATPFFFNIKNF
jgi:hypothetical protein